MTPPFNQPINLIMALAKTIRCSLVRCWVYCSLLLIGPALCVTYSDQTHAQALPPNNQNHQAQQTDRPNRQIQAQHLRAWTESMQAAQEAIQARNLNRAVRSLDAAIGIAENDLKDLKRAAASANALADLYFTKEQYSNAIQTYAQTVDLLTQAFSKEHPSLGMPLYNLGLCLMFEEQYQQAADRLTQSITALENNPRHPPELIGAYLYCVQNLLYADNNQRAAEMSDQAYEKFHDQVPEQLGHWGMFLNLRGYAHQQLFEQNPQAAQNAVIAFQQSVDWHANQTMVDEHSFAEAYLGLGEAYQKTNALDQAIETYTQAAAILKSTGDTQALKRLAYAYEGLANTYRQSDQHEQAIQTMRQAIDTADAADELDLSAHFLTSISEQLRKADLTTQAINWVQESLAHSSSQSSAQSSPNSSSPWPTYAIRDHILKTDLAVSLIHRGLDGDLQQAQQLLKKTIPALEQLDSDWLGYVQWARQNLANSYWVAGDFEEAIKLTQQRIAWIQQLDSKHADNANAWSAYAYADLCDLQLLLNQESQAIENMRRHVKLIIRQNGARSPAAARARTRLAQTLGRTGDLQASSATFEEAITLLAPMGSAGIPIRSWLYFSYGRELFDSGQYEQALPWLLKSFDEQKEDYHALYTAACLIKLGQHDKAQTMLNDWAQNRPKLAGEDWPGHLVDLMRGQTNGPTLVALAQAQGGYTQRRWLCELYFYWALLAIAQDDTTTAQKRLKQCVEQNVYQFVEWESAQRILTTTTPADPSTPATPAASITTPAQATHANVDD